MEKKVTIKNFIGLHARPAALLVQQANSFPAEITLMKGDKKANAKSLLNILALGVGANEQVTIITSGEQAEQALLTITDFLEAL